MVLSASAVFVWRLVGLFLRGGVYRAFFIGRFISVNEWSIEELSVVIEDTSCLVISESASIIEREIIGKTGKCTDLSGG